MSSGGIIILRVISGIAKGHKLKTLKGDNTRPTSDRVKESLFNIIAPFIEGATVLDLFSGSGSLGIEALSRGAKKAILVDKSVESVDIIRENLNNTKLNDFAKVLNNEYKQAINLLVSHNEKFDLIFLDPPYNKGIVDDSIILLQQNELFLSGAIIVCETQVDEKLPDVEGFLEKRDERKYGDTKLTFYKYTKYGENYENMCISGKL